MADEPEGADISGSGINDLRVMLDLERLGELIAAVAHRFSVIRGLEPPDFDGEEMRDLAISGWRHVCLMADRTDFENSVMADLQNLDTQEGVTQNSVTHKPEFGL